MFNEYKYIQREFIADWRVKSREKWGPLDAMGAERLLNLCALNIEHIREDSLMTTMLYRL